MHSHPNASLEYQKYFEDLKDRLNILYDLAEKAKNKGIDPRTVVEPKITLDIAERVEKLIGPPGIGARIRQLEHLDRREAAFKIAGEIVEGGFGKFGLEAAADQAIRSALAILTEGVTIAPIEGIPKIKIKENPDKTSYLSVYFAGPIRPAGGTAQALTLVVADFVRQKLGLDRFKPSDDVVKRFVEEVRIYERQIRRFQYHVSDSDLEYAIENLPVEATGVGTDRYEVSSFRNIPGIETNRIRGGALIVVVDGVIGRARKLLSICQECHLEGWDWLDKIEKLNSESETTSGFMEEIIVGRPVFSFPNRVGGFRLRYGRARTTGLAAVGIHPASMVILNKFLTTGVQLRTEFPGKSAVVTPVDSIEPPIVKLKDGSVVRIESAEKAERLQKIIDQILYLGDILINAGDFIQNNKPLLPSGYDENQWILDLREAVEETGLQAFSENIGVPEERIIKFLEDSANHPTPREALAISLKGVPIHPRYNYHWSQLTREDLLCLRNNLMRNWPKSEPYIVKLEEKNKEVLEKLLIPHRVTEGGILLEEEGVILEKLLDLNNHETIVEGESPLEMVQRISGLVVREKAPTFVGARMGRPEKSKVRKLSPYVHGLFPLENAGGPQRDIIKAMRRKIYVEIHESFCPKCGRRIFGARCPDCRVDSKTYFTCPRCGRRIEENFCPNCRVGAVPYKTIGLNVQELLNEAQSKVGGQLPEKFKCVKRLMNKKRMPEPLVKGLLRARYDLSVFKDGTIRFDITDVPLTHFKPSEIGVPLERLKSLGYSKDVRGAPLESPDQILELKIQDIILPEGCGDYFVQVSKFIDDLLSKVYGLPAYYKVNNRFELVGHLVMGLAPHTSAAVVGRLLGYTKNRVCYAHPLWHAAKRRNCDGDEDAIMLGLDPLLNFSEDYLPEQIGGMMDAPLFIISTINPREVDKEAHNLDVSQRYPKEFYELSMKSASPSEYAPLMDTIGRRLGTESQFEGYNYTENCSNINLGSHQGAYTSLKTMMEKLESQLELSERLRSVDVKVVALRVLNSHFMKDIVGNLTAFTNQGFRCIKCNLRYRRPPLKGHCLRCGGSISLTVHKGGIEKYFESALKLVKKYDLGEYYAQRLHLVKSEIASLFRKVEVEEAVQKKRVDLTDFIRG
ncbi:MAG: DNA polymerase II large subunit [Candidatus Bathyarchaeia archaeon]